MTNAAEWLEANSKKSLLLVIIFVAIFASAIFSYADMTIEKPLYEETELTQEQQVMRSNYIAAREIPELFTSSDGEVAYCTTKEPSCPKQRPEWYTSAGKITLSKEEKQQIAHYSTVQRPNWAFLSDPQIRFMERKGNISTLRLGMTIGLILGVVVGFSSVTSAGPKISFLATSALSLGIGLLFAYAINMEVGLHMGTYLGMGSITVSVFSTLLVYLVRINFNKLPPTLTQTA